MSASCTSRPPLAPTGQRLGNTTCPTYEDVSVDTTHYQERWRHRHCKNTMQQNSMHSIHSEFLPPQEMQTVQRPLGSTQHITKRDGDIAIARTLCSTTACITTQNSSHHRRCRHSTCNTHLQHPLATAPPVSHVRDATIAIATVRQHVYLW